MAVSSVGGATYESWSGCTSAMLAGLGFGNWSLSGRSRVGRAAAGTAMGMTDGRVCEAPRWRSSSAVECRLSAGGRRCGTACLHTVAAVRAHFAQRTVHSA